jgi:hypothetical protein
VNGSLPHDHPRSRSLVDYSGRVLLTYAAWVALWIGGQIVVGVVRGWGRSPDPATVSSWPDILSLLPVYYLIHFAFLAPVSILIAAVAWTLRGRFARRATVAIMAAAIWAVFVLFLVTPDRPWDDGRIIEAIRWVASGALFGALLPYPAARIRRT